jgi:hypothetical protein
VISPIKKCIYCIEDASASTQAYHVLSYASGNTEQRRYPQAEIVLPKTVVCDPCNNYFGSKVEPYLINHPYVQLWRVLEGIEGRRGRPVYQAQGLNLSIRRSNLLVVEGNIDQIEVSGSGEIKIKTPSMQEVNHREVSRALHKIAFEKLYLDALKEFDNDVEKARDAILSKDYDHLRQYVRKPGPNEYRPYGMARGGGTGANIGRISFTASSDKRIITPTYVGYSITFYGVRFVVTTAQDPNLLDHMLKQLEKDGLSSWMGANEVFWTASGGSIIPSS